MRSNGLLKWLVLPVALLVLFFGIRLFSGGGDQPRPMADAAPQLTAEEARGEWASTDADRAKAVKDMVDAGSTWQQALMEVLQNPDGQQGQQGQQGQSREEEPNAGV